MRNELLEGVTSGLMKSMRKQSVGWALTALAGQLPAGRRSERLRGIDEGPIRSNGDRDAGVTALLGEQLSQHGRQRPHGASTVIDGVLLLGRHLSSRDLVPERNDDGIEAEALRTTPSVRHRVRARGSRTASVNTCQEWSNRCALVIVQYPSRSRCLESDLRSSPGSPSQPQHDPRDE